MSWLNTIERRLEPLVPNNLTLYLVIGQTFVYLTSMLGVIDRSRVLLIPAAVTEGGEVWRLFTFIFYPPAQHWLFIAFALYFLYLMGSAIEEQWGKGRYALFLLIGYLLTVGVAFLTPYVPATNLFIGTSIFLAFAVLNPNFTIMLFFVLPVQVKWLGLLTGGWFLFQFAVGGVATKLSIAAALGNFLLFLGPELYRTLTSGQRRAVQARQRQRERETPRHRHRCHICGKTDLTNPEMDFRYCSKCAGDQCYCPDHIRNHEHVLTDSDAKP